MEVLEAGAPRSHSRIHLIRQEDDASGQKASSVQLDLAWVLTQPTPAASIDGTVDTIPRSLSTMLKSSEGIDESVSDVNWLLQFQPYQTE